MGILSAKEVLENVVTRRESTVNVPELGGEIRMLQPSADNGLQLQELGREVKDNPKKDRAFTEKLLLISCVDAAGAPLFTEKSLKTFLARVSQDTLTALVKGAAELLKPLKGEEDAAGNSEGSTSDA